MDWTGIQSNSLDSIPYHRVPGDGVLPSRAKRKGAPVVFTTIRATRPIIRR